MDFYIFHLDSEQNNFKGGKNMERNQASGILAIILGLIFIICPIFSSVALTVLIGLSLVFLGIVLILSGFTAFNIIIGILAIIVGIGFTFNIAALSFLLGLQFYIIGILIILTGITGLFSGPGVSKITSILMILVGIISFALGGLSIGQPLYAPIIIGVALIIQGIRLYLTE